MKEGRVGTFPFTVTHIEFDDFGGKEVLKIEGDIDYGDMKVSGQAILWLHSDGGMNFSKGQMTAIGFDWRKYQLGQILPDHPESKSPVGNTARATVEEDTRNPGHFRIDRLRSADSGHKQLDKLTTALRDSGGESSGKARDGPTDGDEPPEDYDSDDAPDDNMPF